MPPYSFKNHMSLTKDFAMFSHEVAIAQVSGNVDAPEGGFDAIMQAMVCKEQIGWRKDARHLIVFSSDADFHIAGKLSRDLRRNFELPTKTRENEKTRSNLFKNVLSLDVLVVF